MTKIHVPVRDAYDVLIERDILKRCGEIVSQISKADTCAIITDDNVDKLYSETVSQSLTDSGFKVVKFVFPHGEASKNAETLTKIWSFLVQNDITRSDCLIALGGGVVGDITGFAAATFLRGVQYVQIPTSLLAQVDSSVGGKTAVDLPEGKNLVGAFKQPAVVLCDPETLRTLPEKFLIDGMGEVVKYGMIADEKLFDLLLHCNLDNVHEYFDTIIPICVAIKKNVVAEDELDTGLRMILNFGHTIGHAIEAYYHYEMYTHGCAVAAGMCIMTKYCNSPEEYELLKQCVENYHLPTETDAPLTELVNLCGHDKKRAGQKLRWITCNPIGKAQIHTGTIPEFRAIFEREV